MTHRPRFLLICMACGASNVTGDTTLDYDGEFINGVACRHCGNGAVDIDEMFASPATPERPQGATWAEAYAQAIASPAAPEHPHGEPQQPTIDDTWKRDTLTGKLVGDLPLGTGALANYGLKPWKVAGVTNESVPEVNRTYSIDSQSWSGLNAWNTPDAFRFNMPEQSWNMPAPSPDTPVVVRHGADLRGIGAIV